VPEKIDKIEKQPPTHVVVVQWVENILTILAQAPVPHANKTKKRVLFVDHQPSLVPQLEALGIARSIAKRTKRPDPHLTSPRGSGAILVALMRS
jgi:hypothetical protein